MAWIEVHDTLREHRKTYALSGSLKIEQYAAVGLVVSLWTWAINHAQDGDLSNFPDAAIANACHWKKKPGILIDALINVGFLTSELQIHDWDMYAGKLIDRREANAKRNREARAKKASRDEQRAHHERITSASCDEQRAHHERITSASCDEQRAHHERITSASCDVATVPNSTVPNLNVSSLRSDTPPKSPKGDNALFDRFWSAYPRKEAKAVARKAFARHKPDDALLGAMLNAIEKQKRSNQWVKDNGQFIPLPATWLNQERWTDEKTEVNHGQQPARPDSAAYPPGYFPPSEAF
jgi:hypothetical protein